MDLIDTAADVIRELDQLKQRIRELETDRNMYKQWYENLNGQRRDIEERIAKAKAILESSDGMTAKMKAALEALEGK